MAQYYQIQNFDDLKMYTADVQVVHVASDDVGVSNPNRAQVNFFYYFSDFNVYLVVVMLVNIKY